jgi:hypothetical protein
MITITCRILWIPVAGTGGGADGGGDVGVEIVVVWVRGRA